VLFTRNGNRVQPDFDLDLSAIAAQTVEIPAGTHRSPRRAREVPRAQVRMRGAESFGNKGVDVGAKQLATRATEQLLGLGIDEDDLSVAGNDNYRDRGGLDNKS
jgi:hypothetical protein